MTNFAAAARKVGLRVNWERAGLAPGRFWFALDSDGERCQSHPLAPATSLETRLEGYGVGGWLMARDQSAWLGRLERFARPYPSAPEEAAYRQALAALKAARFAPPLWEECHLRVSIPNWPNNYEDSIWFDLFDNRVELLDLADPAAPRLLGYVSRGGLLASPPEKADCLLPGDATPWMPLRGVLRGPGKGGVAKLGLATRRGQFEFYSFVKAEVSPRPELCEDTREILFNNDIDLDWSLLTFDIRLA